MSTFKVGDEVICVKTHSQGLVKKGETYTITMLEDVCKCGLCIGINNMRRSSYTGALLMMCVDCGCISNNHPFVTVSCALFQPLKPAKQKTSYRMATLEILTQFPTVKETSDQPFNVPVEKKEEAGV